jgi:type I restriction enzyme, S subunit
MSVAWAVSTIGDHCEVIAGQSPVGSAYNGDRRGTPFYQGKKDFTEKYIGEPTVWTTEVTKIAVEGDVLMSVRAPVGPVNFATDRICIGRGLAAIRPKPSLDREFLFYQLLHLQPVIAGKEGAVFASINKSDIASLPIVVPPLAEQKRIVATLDQAFEAISAATTTVERCAESADALFKSLLDGEVQGKSKDRPPSMESVKQLEEEIQRSRIERLGPVKARRHDEVDAGGEQSMPFPLPKNWKCFPLSALTVGIADGVHQKPKYVGHGIPFVTVRNLTAGDGISFENIKFITHKDHLEFVKRTKPEKGDILITKDGTIGVVRVIDTDVEFSIFVSVALVKPAIPQIMRFLAYALSAPCIQSQIVPKGAALKHLYLADLRRLMVPLPPLEEQRKIVEKLDLARDATRKLSRVYQMKKKALDRLRLSMLSSAFAAQL